VNCPYCNFHFEKILSPATLQEIQAEELIPALCEQCANISLIERGIIRKVTSLELEAIKESPGYKSFIEPIINMLLEKDK
jgi:hypothetical protein